MKDMFMAAHEQLIAEYLEEYPSATEQQAYDRTTGTILERMADTIGDWIDAAHDRIKYGEI